jgi:hypothetical protein
MRNIIVKARTRGARPPRRSDLQPARALRRPESSHAKHQSNWRLGLLRALCYCSTVAPVPFVRPTPRDPEESQ